jgi:hypothetical protein
MDERSESIGATESRPSGLSCPVSPALRRSSLFTNVLAVRKLLSNNKLQVVNEADKVRQAGERKGVEFLPQRDASITPWGIESGVAS